MDSKQEFTVMQIQRLLRPVKWKKLDKVNLCHHVSCRNMDKAEKKNCKQFLADLKVHSSILSFIIDQSVILLLFHWPFSSH